MTTSLFELARTLGEQDALSVTQAQAFIAQSITAITETETLPLKQLSGRVLAADIISPINVPAHDNSAMDGYAFHAADLNAGSLRVVGTAFAGKRFSGTVGRGECVRIMTGAVMPQACDTVVPQELTRDNTKHSVSIPAGVVLAGANRRLAGEDLALGKAALHKGKLLTPADLGLLASLGIGEAPVQRKLRVAHFSTGDELRSIGEPLAEGCIYDSNRYTLHGMLSRLGCEVIDMGVVKDDPASLEAALRQACEQADAIITSGGVSAGDADYMKQLLASLGEVLFWKIDMRPGRPMAFGKLTANGHSAMLFGLPGNPVAVMVTFYFFARAALRQMMGATPLPQLIARVRSAQPIRKKPGRTEYQRGIITLDAEGLQSVRITGSQGSGILSSMSEANCMVLLQHAQGDVQAGELVDVILFEGLL
ncbi:MAG: gephyrin-like molybdotransferase Glp [Burkholderiaceae bacterium]